MNRRGTLKVASLGGRKSFRRNVITWLGLRARSMGGQWGRQLGSTDRKTCFCPSLKPGSWRATVFATSAMVRR